MQKFSIIIISSIITSIICIGLFKYFESPDVYYINQAPQVIQSPVVKTVTDRIDSNTEINKPNDFVEASKSGKKSSVYIRAIPKSKAKRLLGASSGSGVIISEDGYIVTNNHVIENADEIEVTLHNNETYKAKVIGTDTSTDIALLQIRGDKLQGIPLGNSDQVEVGEWV